MTTAKYSVNQYPMQMFLRWSNPREIKDSHFL